MKRRYILASLILTAITVLITIVFYKDLPPAVPTHWDFEGNADRYGEKISVLILPGVLCLLNLLFFKVLPSLSPKRFEVESFQKTYDFVMFLVIALFCYVHFLVLRATVAGSQNVDRVLPAGIFLFFAFIGNVLGRIKRNFWVGVRTPWTLANERVWTDTHRLAAKLFVASGFIAFLLTLAGVSIIISACVIGIALSWSAIYSLIAYKRMQKRGEI